MKQESPCQDDQDQLRSKAEQSFDFGDYEGAIELFSKLLKKYPDNPLIWNVHQWIGMAHYRLHRSQEAIRHLSLAVDHPEIPKEGLAWMQLQDYLGEANFDLGKLDEALPYLREAEAHVQSYMDEGWLEEMVSYFLAYGRCLTMLGRFDEAADKFRVAAEALPDSDDCRGGRSVLEFELARVGVYAGKYEETERHLPNVVFEDLAEPLRTVYHYVYAMYESHMRHYVNAIKHGHATLNLGIGGYQEADVLLVIGGSYYYLKNGSRAREFLDKAWKHPDSEHLKKKVSAFRDRLAEAGY